MRYRVLGRSGLRVGEIGVGCEGFLEKTPEEVREWLDVMEAAGVNCIDLYTPNPEFRSNLGQALRGPPVHHLEGRPVQAYPEHRRGPGGL